MSEQKAPIIVKRIKKVAAGHPWRRVENRLCRFRDRHDGVLPADVAVGFDCQG